VRSVSHSLLEAGAFAGLAVAIASPAGYEPDDAVLSDAGDHASP